jgi:GT2 family glycosyltransferase
MGAAYVLLSNDAPVSIVNSCLEVFDSRRKDHSLVAFGENIYVNGAWSILIGMCKTDYLCLLNDDAIVSPGTVEAFEDCFDRNEDTVLAYPVVTSKFKEFLEYDNTLHEQFVLPSENLTEDGRAIGAYGTFIFLRTSWAKSIGPIPAKYKIWFGDNWIREQAYRSKKGVVRIDRVVYHEVSQSMPKKYGGPGHDDSDDIEKKIDGDLDVWMKGK